MAKPKNYPHQTCIRLSDDERARMDDIRKLLPHRRGEKVTDSAAVRWMLGQDDLLERARTVA